MMRREKASKRPPLTEAQRKAKPPVSHPIFLTHPLTGRKVLYANPGYSMRINELPEEESAEILAFLFEHQTKPEYRYAHVWEEGDLMLWEDIGTIHNAVADYAPASASSQKVAKQDGDLTLVLRRTPDILKALGERRAAGHGPAVLVGFAAETENGRIPSAFP